MRLRLLTLCPELDFGDYQERDYVSTLVQMFVGAYHLSSIPDTPFTANELKLHLRSPAERSFFAAFGAQLDGSSEFAKVETRGSWLHLTK